VHSYECPFGCLRLKSTAEHNQLLRFCSNGQPVGISQLTHGEGGALERRRLEGLKALRAVFELCQDANPTSPGTNCTLTREQIAARSKLSGSAVERGTAWLRSGRVIYTRWLKHNRWEVHFKAPTVRRILAASLPAAMVLIEAQWKLRQQVAPSREGSQVVCEADRAGLE
jgi:hypothetical protein